MIKSKIGGIFLGILCWLTVNGQAIIPMQPPRDRGVIVPQSRSANYPNYTGMLPSPGTANFSMLRLRQSYPMVDFKPITNYHEIIQLPSVKVIRLIDSRFDNKKVGLLPCETDMQKKMLSMLGIRFTDNLTGWLKNNFVEKNLLIDSGGGNQRQLILVLKKFWFSNSATERYKASHHDLVTTLHYRFDIFSSKDFGFYPQKKLEGFFQANYNHSASYNQLCDSLLSMLGKELGSLNFESHETEKNWVAPADFNEHYSKALSEIRQAEKRTRGLYASYEDFLANSPIADSADMVMKYNNNERGPLFACQLATYLKGEPVSSTKAWGYFDGETIYLNIGSGFYVRLIRNQHDYLFLFLKEIAEDNVKSDMLNQLNINDTPYRILKDYTRSYALTYQLDYETGKLY